MHEQGPICMKICSYSIHLISGQCREVHYHLVLNDYSQKPSIKAKGANTNYLHVFYPSIVVEAYTRRYHIDFNDFVSAVGGSLGLFLGFSFLGVFFEMYNIIRRISDNRAKKMRGKNRKQKSVWIC